MTELMRRRRALMGQKTAEDWINILPHIDWTDPDGFVTSNLRAITQQMLPITNASTALIPCPFSSNGSYASWANEIGVSRDYAGVFIREYDQSGNYLGSNSKWGGGATTTLSLRTNTAFIRIGFQRYSNSSGDPDNWVLYHPLTINSVSYNTEFNGQKVKA